MAIVPQVARHFIMTGGGALVIGDIGDIPRLQPPPNPVAEEIILGPVVGHVAVEMPDTIQLIVTRSTVASVSGYTVTLVVQNNPAPIYYTLDGTSVTTSSPRYTRPVVVTGTPGQVKTLKYKAFALAQSGYTDSVEVTVILYVPQALDLDIGVANTADPLVKDITITPEPAGSCEIRYTIDGSLPSPTHGTVYTASFQVTGSPGGAVVIHAIAYPTQPLSETYYLLQSDLETVTVTF